MKRQSHSTYPQFAKQLKQLVNLHQGLEDEPLVLAVYYAPERDPEDVFLFEVIDGFGENSIDPDKNLFEYGFSCGFRGNADPASPWGDGRHLHTVLTNPVELEVALKDNWDLATELRTAVKQNKAKVIAKQDPEGERLWGLISG